MAKRARISHSGRGLLFEGQTRLSFLAEGAQAAGGRAYLPILVDCDDETRSRRLLERQQPELANEDMMNWARYLRRAAKKSGCEMLNSSALSLEQCVMQMMARLRGTPSSEKMAN
jgi:hypothetical protein